jgi:hypothetical protein
MEPPDALRTFRLSFYECFRRRSDALFELAEGRDGLGMRIRRGVRMLGIEVGNGPTTVRATRVPRRCGNAGSARATRTVGVCFVPEAGEEFFRDDAHRLVGMLHTGSDSGLHRY